MEGRELLVIALVCLGANTVVGAKPSVLGMTMESVNGLSTAYIGSRDRLRITLELPDGITGDVQVVFMASLTETVFVISDYFGATVGADITSVENTGWDVEATVKANYTLAEGYGDPAEKIRYYTMATLEPGDIDNSGTSGADADSTITIEFEITLVSMGSTGSYNDGDNYLPSAVLSDSGSAVVLVSRQQYTIYAEDSGFTKDATFSLASLTNVEEDGKSEETQLTMTMNHPRARVKVEAYTLDITKAIAPIEISYVSAGSAYEYSFVSENIVATRYENCSVLDMERQFLELDIGEMVNKVSNDGNPNTANYDVVLSIKWLVYDHTVVGQTFRLGVGVDVDGDDLYVTTLDVTIVDRNPASAAMSGITAEVAGSATATVTPGVAYDVDVTLDTAPGSFQVYDVQLTTREQGLTESKVSLLSVTDGVRGANLPCEETEVAAVAISNTDASNPNVMNSGSWQFAVLNHGLMTGNNKEFAVKVVAFADAAKDTVYEVIADVGGTQGIAQLTIGDPPAIAADFSVAFVTTDTVETGGLATGSVTLHTVAETSHKYDVQLTTRVKGGTESKLSMLSYTYETQGAGTFPIVTNDPVTLSVAKTDSNNPYINNEGVMDIVTINNGGLTSNDKGFTVKMLAPLDATLGTVYEFVVDIGGTVKTVDFTIGGPRTLSTTFSVTNVTPLNVKAGETGTAKVTVATAAESWQQFDVQINTREKTTTTSRATILSHTIVASGGTEPIVVSQTPFTTTNTDAANPKIMDQATTSLVVLNEGTAATNDVVFDVDFLVMPDVADSTIYEFVVDINGQEHIVEYTVTGQVVFDTNPPYTYAMSATTPVTVVPGGTFTTQLVVTTADDTMPGAMSIVIPEPTGTAYVELASATSQTMGPNVICPPTGTLLISTTDWVPADSDNAKSTVSIPYVCNVAQYNGATDNDWVIEFSYTLRNHSDLQTAQTLSFGVDVLFSANLVFETDVTVNVNPMTTTSTTSTSTTTTTPAPGATTTTPAPGATTTTQAGQVGGSQNQHGLLGGSTGGDDDDSEFPVWVVLLSIAGAMVLIALITSFAVIMKKRMRRKRSRVDVKEFCGKEKE